MHWFTRVPLGVLKVYLGQLMKLQAEESVLAATRVAVGSGSASEGSVILRRWQSEITPEEEVSIDERRERFKRSVGRLTAMGYGLRKVPVGGTVGG